MLKDKLAKIKTRFPEASAPEKDPFEMDESGENDPPISDMEAEEDLFAEAGAEEDPATEMYAEAESEDLVAELEKRGFSIEPPAEEGEGADPAADPFA